MISTQLSTVWLVMAGAVALIGALIVAWALFSDRSRGRKRCPKCWYDMSATVGLICPECGRDAERPARLEKTRRRWVIAAIGMVVALGSLYPALKGFQKRNGLWSLMPTEAIIQWYNVTGWPKYRGSASSEELFYRLVYGDASVSQRHRVYKTLLPQAIKSRDRWPVTLPMRVGIRPGPFFQRDGSIFFTVEAVNPKGSNIRDSLQGAGLLVNYLYFRYSDPTHELAVIDSSTTRIDVRAEVPGWNGSHTIRVTPVATIDDAITPVRDTSVDAKVQSAVQIHLYDRGPERRYLHLTFGRYDMLAPQGLEDLAFGLRVEFRSGSDVFASCRCFFSDAPFGSPATCEVLIEGDVDRLFDLNATTAQWTVVVSGDGEMALRRFDREKYWAGSITVPKSQVLRYVQGGNGWQSVP